MHFCVYNSLHSTIFGAPQRVVCFCKLTDFSIILAARASGGQINGESDLNQDLTVSRVISAPDSLVVEQC